jgi:Rod binding domain-containing protein
VRQAAQEFEAVMLRQMVEALRKAARMGGEAESGHQLADHLVEDALASHLARSGGIGLADAIARAVEDKGGRSVNAHLSLERSLRFRNHDDHRAETRVQVPFGTSESGDGDPTGR